eukprot:11205519-Lingulodinium_polyedra.AAC.1
MPFNAAQCNATRRNATQRKALQCKPDCNAGCDAMTYNAARSVQRVTRSMQLQRATCIMERTTRNAITCSESN